MSFRFLDGTWTPLPSFDLIFALELVTIIIETAFMLIVNSLSKTKMANREVVTYVIVANVLSFIMGWVLLLILPTRKLLGMWA